MGKYRCRGQRETCKKYCKQKVFHDLFSLKNENETFLPKVCEFYEDYSSLYIRYNYTKLKHDERQMKKLLKEAWPSLGFSNENEVVRSYLKMVELKCKSYKATDVDTFNSILVAIVTTFLFNHFFYLLPEEIPLFFRIIFNLLFSSLFCVYIFLIILRKMVANDVQEHLVILEFIRLCEESVGENPRTEKSSSKE